MELFYFNDKTYNLNLAGLYESLNENDSLNVNTSNQDSVNIIKQNKNNENFVKGLIDIMSGNKVNDENIVNSSLGIISMIDNLNTIQNSIESFALN